MSPTVFRHGPYRFFFFSREESRPHIHVSCSDGEAKFWTTPDVMLALNKGLSDRQIGQLEKLVKEHRDEINQAWQKHFGG